MPEPTSAFLRACRGLPVSHTPVWFMRQAGRYLPQFQQLLATHSLTGLMETPDLAARATLQPIDVLGVDAAILFSDILPPLRSLGLRVNLAGSDGPAIENPLRSNYEIDLLPTPPAEEQLSGILETVHIAAHELEGRNIPLLGFGGAPFTLAAYAVEGGPTRDFSRTKALMYGEPAAWKRLMKKLVTIQADFLAKQVRQGASALQVFDSWSGLALSRGDYRRYVLPHHRSLFEALKRTGVPVIHFSTGTAAYIADVAEAGGDVLSVDWRMPLNWFWSQVDGQLPLQGNLDPVALLTPWRELKYRTDAVLAQAESRPGHIFNLGHGVLPATSADTVKRVVDYVHARTERDNDGRGE